MLEEFPTIKSAGRTNYSIEAFNKCDDRMKQQLTWERTINIHGKSGRNVSMDVPGSTLTESASRLWVMLDQTLVKLLTIASSITNATRLSLSAPYLSKCHHKQ